MFEYACPFLFTGETGDHLFGVSSPFLDPHISHFPWVLQQGPIPHGILNEVTKIIEDKWKSGVYEPSSSSYNSQWFCVFKKDGKSL